MESVQQQSATADLDVEPLPIQVCSDTPPTYTIVMDNLDFFVSTHHQSSQRGNKSIHWTHHIAVEDRIPLNYLSSSKPAYDLEDYDVGTSLPEEDLQQHLRREFIVLGSRMMCQHLSAFSSMSDVVVRHMPHQYTKEMTQRSKDVSIYPDIQQFLKCLMFLATCIFCMTVIPFCLLEVPIRPPLQE